MRNRKKLRQAVCACRGFLDITGNTCPANAAAQQIGICRGKCGPEQHCHSEPVLTLVWESPSNFGLSIVIQTVLLHRFLEFIQEKWHFYPGDCHASVRTGSQ